MKRSRLVGAAALLLASCSHTPIVLDVKPAPGGVIVEYGRLQQKWWLSGGFKVINRSAKFVKVEAVK